jgi:hypothetical protein
MDEHYYYDATGVLILDRVTPVITALFGAFHLDASYPGHGLASIARTSGSKDPQWDDVRDGLAHLAAELGLPDRTDDPSIADLLRSLAAHFGVARDEELDLLLRHGDFAGDLDLDVLFRLALRFDDGHRLTVLSFAGCRHCSPPRLFEFGGDACYLSREVCLVGNTLKIGKLGMLLRDAVRKADVEKASSLLMEETVDLLSSLRDGPFHRQVLRRLAERLTVCALA